MPTLTELKDRFKIENPAGWTYVPRSGGDPHQLIKLAPNREMIVLYEGGGFMKAEWVPISEVAQGPYIPENFAHGLIEPVQGSKEALDKLVLAVKRGIERQEEHAKKCTEWMLKPRDFGTMVDQYVDKNRAEWGAWVLRELLSDIETLRDDPAHYDECHDVFGAPR